MPIQFQQNKKIILRGDIFQNVLFWHRKMEITLEKLQFDKNVYNVYTFYTTPTEQDYGKSVCKYRWKGDHISVSVYYAIIG